MFPENPQVLLRRPTGRALEVGLRVVVGAVQQRYLAVGEPVRVNALHLRQVPDEAGQRHRRGRTGTNGELLRAEARALVQLAGAVVVEPPVEHAALVADAAAGLGPALACRHYHAVLPGSSLLNATAAARALASEANHHHYVL